MADGKPRRWRKRLLWAALLIPAALVALWCGNVWRLTAERDRLRAAAERFGPVGWHEYARKLLAEHHAQPGAADELLAATEALGGRRGVPLFLDQATREWLEKPTPGPLPAFAAQALVRGQPVLAKLHAVVGKPPGLLTRELITDEPWSIVLGNIQDIREANRLFQLEALAARAAGDARGAYRAALAASRLSRQLDRDPFCITWVIGRGVEREAATRTLPIALGMAPPTAGEFAALDAAWDNFRVAHAALARALRGEHAIHFAVAQNANEWAMMRGLPHFRGIPVPVPSLWKKALDRLERTDLGEPLRLRAQTALLRQWIAVEEHLAAGRDLATFPFHDAEPNIQLYFLTRLPIALRRSRGIAHAARLALRLARDPRAVPPSFDGLGLADPPHAPAVGFRKTEKGFALRIEPQGQGDPQDEPAEIAVEFAKEEPR